jgi:hypothetical protein
MGGRGGGGAGMRGGRGGGGRGGGGRGGGGGRPMARALYAYQGTTPDELTFNEGEMLAIITEDPGGWWECESNGRRGWVRSSTLVFVVFCLSTNSFLFLYISQIHRRLPTTCSKKFVDFSSPSLLFVL